MKWGRGHGRVRRESGRQAATRQHPGSMHTMAVVRVIARKAASSLQATSGQPPGKQVCPLTASESAWGGTPDTTTMRSN